MSQGPTGHRPGGLTALAVLNFIFGGFYALGVLGLAVVLFFAGAITSAAAREGAPVIAPIMPLLYLAFLLYAIVCFLLIASGVGYLQQKRFVGKTFGSVYGLIGIVGVLVNAIGYHNFGIEHIIGLVYPVLTLTLLNTVFKDDFPNP